MYAVYVPGTVTVPYVCCLYLWYCDSALCMLFMFTGFVISAICELERNAIQLALGSFYPTLLLSGKLLSMCYTVIEGHQFI